MEEKRKAVKFRITKCYLIEVIDKNGNELESDFSFMPYKEVKQEAEKMIATYNKCNQK